METKADSGKLKNALSTLLNGIEFVHYEDGIADLLYNFSGEAFGALVSSPEFAAKQSEERRALFNQYEKMMALLRAVEKYVDDYPTEVHIESIEAIIFEPDPIKAAS
jgi:hypothetical protein